MDDILASIRRILSDEEKAAAAKATSKPPPSDGVLMLDQSMMVAEPAPTIPVPPDEAHMSEHMAPEPEPEPDPVAPLPALLPPDPPAAAAPLVSPIIDPAAPLVAPEAAAAASSMIGNLMRTLASERNVAVHRGGPTIEDLVREEMRPLLKEWLDMHLPPLVERLVRAEIERVVGRSAQ